MMEMIQIIAYLFDAFCRATDVEFRRSIDDKYQEKGYMHFSIG